MPKAKIENLMSELHDIFAGDEVSPQQQALVRDLQARIEGFDPGVPDPTPVETVELLLDTLGDEHPKTTLILRELLDTLKNIGV